MAPSNGPAMGRRPPRAVVPAIPLPFVKRQAAAAAAAAAAGPANSPAKISPAVERIWETKLTNGRGQKKIAKDRVAAISASSTASEGTESQIQSPQEEVNRAAVKANGHTPSAVSIPEPATTFAEAAIPDQPDQPITETKIDNRNHTEASSDQSPVDAADDHHCATNDTKQQSVEPQPVQFPSSEQEPSPLSSNGFQMPPPFQLANRPFNMAVNGGDQHRGPRPPVPVPNGPPHLHQPHPSNGSIHFGAFHDSTSSSPAPPLSGGIAPPPGMPLPDARYMGHAGNGFPPMMPYGPDMMPPVSTYNNFGRPAMSYGPVDYPGFGNSQTSTHAEDNAIYPQYPSGPVRNGVAGRGDDYPRMMPNPGPPPHMMSQVDDADGLIGYLQQYFGSSDMSDCTLELRYADDRAPPVRIPGHRIIFARSSELREQALRLSPIDGPQHVLILQTKNRWVRSDSFYIAVQRLYGLPLFQIPPGFKLSDTMDAGSVADRFDFALSYAAAGYILGWESLLRRGCEVAIQLLNWQTMERALEFALEEHWDGGPHDSYKYGEGSRAVLNAVVHYIIYNLPANFSIDSSLPDPAQYARLPPHPSQPQTPFAQRPGSPAIARGTSSVHLGQGRRSQQIAGIQFGDLSLADGKNAASSDTPKASQQPRPVSHAVLSSVLLNLPFAHLKMALESAGAGAVNSWASAESRHRVIKDAVAEREARRLRAVETVKAGRVEDSESILKQLSSPEPRTSNKWSVLGWQEEILPYGNPNGPALGRQWAPLTEPQSGPRAEYP